MNRDPRFFNVWTPQAFPAPRCSPGEEEIKPDLERRMKEALLGTLERRDTMAYVLAHSRRVARVAVALGRLVDLSEEELTRLRTSAELHEIGMVGIPSNLMTRRGGLSSSELQLVRAHARLGAEMVRATHDPKTSRLIEHQYQDYDDLRRSMTDTRELLLCGILRVADVYDAVTAPRPYQQPLAEQEWKALMRIGSGTKFHPAAVLALLRWNKAAI